MSDKSIRKPVGNFFVKRSIQVSIIFRILALVLVTTVLTTFILVLVYNSKAQAGTFYYMSNDIDEAANDIKDVKQVVELSGVLGLVLPAVIAAQVVGLLMAVAVGLFSSRKVAVPIYKIEKWATQLKNGNLKIQLAFRETAAMKDVTVQCNAVTDTYNRIFRDIDASVKAIETAPSDSQNVTLEATKLRGVLKGLTLD